MTEDSFQPPTPPVVVEAHVKPPLYKRTWFWIVIVSIIYIILLLVLRALWFGWNGFALGIVIPLVIIGAVYTIRIFWKKPAKEEVTEKIDIKYDIPFLKQEFKRYMALKGVELAFCYPAWNEELEGAESVGAEGQESPIAVIKAIDFYKKNDTYHYIVNMQDKNMFKILKNVTDSSIIRNARKTLAKRPDRILPIKTTYTNSGERIVESFERSQPVATPEKVVEKEVLE